MKKLLILLSVCWLWTCSKDSKSPSEPEQPPIVVNLTSLNGQAQKGPFNNGTAINVAELSNTLSPTGRNFSSSITDNTGRFAVANVQLESPYVELRANGYYFNEVKNEISSGQLTLFALSNLTGKTSLNVNILTHLEKNRMVTLMSGDSPKTFAQAKLQAQEEVLAIFDYSRANVPESELLDISQGGAANAKLLAMSAIIQGDLTVGQMSQLLANISTDIASDGKLDDSNLRNTLIENSKNLDLAQVRSNLVAHYTSLGISATIADFESEVNQFLKPPVAQDMSASTGEDTPINITLAASDPEGESLTYTILEVNNATVTLNGNVANYTPNANFNGTDTFTYKANDGTSDSNIATVTMTVSAEDDEPNTQNAAATTDEDVAVVLQLTAEEYDGQSYSFALRSQPTNGSVSLDGANATYTPNQDYNGTDSFTFEATDTTGRMMNVGTATITINPVNDAPKANDLNISLDEDSTKNIILSATDVDNINLFYDIVSYPSINGNSPFDTSEVDRDSLLVYTPPSNWNGTESFTYKANDGTDDSKPSTVTITVNPVNDAPTVEDVDAGEIALNESIDITLTGSDIDNDTLTYSIVDQPSNGTVSINGPIATYTATSAGEDSFTYQASDGTESSNEATISIIVKVGWSKTYGGTGSDQIRSIIQTSDGGYLLGGITESFGNGNWDMYLVKTDAFGKEEWYKTLGGTSMEQTYSVLQTSDGGYLLGGFTFSFGNGDEDMYLVKTDANGNEEWGRTFGGIHQDFAFSVIQTSDGGYLLGGTTSNFGNGGQDMYLVKTDANGNEEWSKTFGGIGSDVALSVIQTSDGGYLLGGTTESFGNGGQDMYLVKTDANGNEEWSKTFGGTSYEGGNSVIQTSDGGYLLGGTTSSFGNGETDMYLAKTDANGNEEWSKTFGGTSWEQAYSVLQTSDGGYLLGGFTFSFGNGGQDMYLVKTDANGNEEWSKMFGGTSSEWGNSVIQTSDGEYLIGGTTLSFGNGSYDMFLVKTDSNGNQ